VFCVPPEARNASIRWRVGKNLAQALEMLGLFMQRADDLEAPDI
jgi:hypothetical protein